MSCSPFDLRDYFLQELSDPQQRRQVEVHVAACRTCHEELDRLRMTEAALFTLREEEIPQRIAFVSDKVFEPSPLRRWLAGFWNSSARLGFASAAMLSVALVVFAATRPAPAPAPVATTTATVNTADIEQRVQAAVDKAAQAIEARYDAKTTQLVNSIRQRDLRERKLMTASFDMESAINERRLQAAIHENRMLKGQYAQLRDEGEKQ
jgi:anti-sigma factor RsiW